MDKQKLLTEYLEHIETARKIAKELGVVFLTMDSGGNFIHNAQTNSLM